MGSSKLLAFLAGKLKPTPLSESVSSSLIPLVDNHLCPAILHPGSPGRLLTEYQKGEALQDSGGRKRIVTGFFNSPATNDSTGTGGDLLPILCTISMIKEGLLS